MSQQERKNSQEVSGIQVQSNSLASRQFQQQQQSQSSTTQRIINQTTTTTTSSNQQQIQKQSSNNTQTGGIVHQQLISGGPIAQQTQNSITQQILSTRGNSASNNKITYIQSPQQQTSTFNQSLIAGNNQTNFQNTTTQNSNNNNNNNSSGILQTSFQSYQSQPQRIIIQEGGGQSRTKSIQQSTQKVVRSESPLAQKTIIQNLYSPPNQQIQVTNSPQAQYIVQKKASEVIQQVQQGPQGYRQIIQVPVQIQEKLVYIEDKQSKETIKELEQRIQELIVENTQLKNKPPQIQIEEKTIYVEDDTKIKHLEQKMTILINEIDKLNRVVNEKAGECDQLRQINYDYESVIQNKTQEADYWKQRCQEFEKGQKEFQFQIQQYRIEIENLNQSLTIRSEEIQNLKNKNSQTENTLRSSNSRITNYEDRITQLVSEIEKLSLAIKNKSEEYETLRYRFQQLESQVINQYQPQIQEYQQRQDLLRSSIRSVESQNTKLKVENDRLAFLNDEVKRLESILVQRNKEIDEWKSRNYQLSIRIEEYTTSENRVQILAQEIERLQRENKILEEDLSHWTYKYAEYSHLEQINRDLLGNQVLLSAEIEALRNQLSIKQREQVQIKTVEVPIRQSQKVYETTIYQADGDMRNSQSQSNVYRTGYQTQTVTRQY